MPSRSAEDMMMAGSYSYLSVGGGSVLARRGAACADGGVTSATIKIGRHHADNPAMFRWLVIIA